MKREAMQILFRCAEIYDKTLLKKNLLIVMRAKNNINAIEVRFPPDAYEHLTGVDVANGISANHFYSLCVDKRLSPKHFEFKADGTTRLKLDVLEPLLKLTSSVKMVTDYNNRRPKLQADKLAGGVNACLGLMLEDNGRFYKPRTVLKADIRDEGDLIEQVLFIIEKNKDEEFYNNITYIAKKVDLKTLRIPKLIRQKINHELINS